MSSVLFSVIMPSYKMGRFIGEALASVGAQSCRDWEVIVVEDCGPEDGTEAIVLEFAATHPDHRVEFIRHEKNTGVSGARNTALHTAKGKYAAFLDPDDLWKSGYLCEMKAMFDAYPETSVVGSPVEAFINTDGTEVIDPLLLSHWQMNQFPDSLAVSCFIQPSATVVRLEAVKTVGYFDTDPLIQHIEDYDMWIRLAVAGYRFNFINRIMCRYRKHPGAATSNREKMEELHNYLVKKHTLFFTQAHSRIIRHLTVRLSRMDQAMRNPFAYLVGRLNSIFK